MDRSAGFTHSDPIKMSDDLRDLHHIGIFVMHVEQIDLVGNQAAVETALLHKHDVQTAGMGIDGRGPHAA